MQVSTGELFTSFQGKREPHLTFSTWLQL